MTETHPFLQFLADRGAYTPPEASTRPRNGTGGASALPAAGDPQATRYASVALAREAEIVAGTQEGQRNHELNRAAFRMGQLVAHGWLSEYNTSDDLINAGVAAGLSYAEAERTVNSGLSAGRDAPRDDVELHQHVGPAYTLETPDAAVGGAQVSAASNGVASHDVGSTEEPSRPRQLVDGGAFIHSALPQVPAVWGDDDDVLWAQGEPLILTGPTGVGKTTLGTNIIAGRLGLISGVLGYTVKPGHRKTLVLAMDRPAQIQRAMARLLRQFPEDALNDRLIVWRGPPPMDLGRHPNMLFQLAELAEADTVVIDSLKDAALKLSDEETGQGLSRAMNYCVSNGVEVLAYHHQTKRTNNASGKPNTLADVYGSSWITAGAGSVVLLWGSAGDLVVELSHLKQPANEVGPLSLGHDHAAGRTFLYEETSEGDQLLDLLSSGPQTAAALASWLHDGADRATVARVQRRLDRLVATGVAARQELTEPIKRNDRGQMVGRPAPRYALVEPNHATVSRRITPATSDGRNRDVSAGRDQNTGDTPLDLEITESRTESRRITENQESPGQTESRTESRRITAALLHATPPPFRGGWQGGAQGSEGPTSWDSHDVEVCSRCYQEAERLIPAPGGKRWCPRCAYPTENPTRRDSKED